MKELKYVALDLANQQMNRINFGYQPHWKHFTKVKQRRNNLELVLNLYLMVEKMHHVFYAVLDY